jgi:hypothetical protein
VTVTQRLLEAVQAAVPAVAEVSVGTIGVPATVTVRPASQQAAAQATIDAFDWSGATHALWLEQQNGALVGRTTAKRLAAAANSSSNALADVTGLSFQLKPNTHYAFEFVGAYTSAAGTTGLSLAVNGPASPALVRAVAQIHESATAVRGGAASAYNATLTGTSSGSATPLPFFIQGNISTGAAGGTFTLRFASEVNNSQVSIAAGSYGLLHCIA